MEAGPTNRKTCTDEQWAIVSRFEGHFVCFPPSLCAMIETSSWQDLQCGRQVRIQLHFYEVFADPRPVADAECHQVIATLFASELRSRAHHAT